MQHRSGLTLLFTGLSGAGKSTLSEALARRLRTHRGRRVTLLDGDEVRTLLSSGLGFSREDRHMNVLRNAYVAGQIAHHGGVCICALIAPYETDRRQFRERVAPEGHYAEIYVSTPLSVCEARDVKGLYAKARAGILKGMTGVDDPYEVPDDPDLALESSSTPVEELVDRLIDWLDERDYLDGPAPATPLRAAAASTEG